MRKLISIAILLLFVERMTAQPCSGYSNKVAAKTEFKNNVVFDSNVGIGTCAPQARFHVMTRPSENVIIGNRLTNAIYIDSSNGGFVGFGDIQNLQNKTSIFVADSFGYTGVQAERMKFLAGIQDGGYVFMGNETDNRNMVLIQDSIGHIKINSQNLIENITDSFRLTANWTNLVKYIGGVTQTYSGGNNVVSTSFAELYPPTTIDSNKLNVGDIIQFSFLFQFYGADELDSMRLVDFDLNTGIYTNLISIGFFAKTNSTGNLKGECSLRSGSIKCNMTIFSGDSATHVFYNESNFDRSHSHELTIQGATSGLGGSISANTGIYWYWPNKQNAW